MNAFIMAFLPELLLLLGSLVLFVITLGNSKENLARRTAIVFSLALLGSSFVCLGQEAVLFSGAYRIDAFSQLLKLVLSFGFLSILLLGARLPDIMAEIKAEYYLFLTLSVMGLIMLVSCIDVITLVVALELSAFPLYFLVAMRREREGQRIQMESAIKYIMFGIAANGVMLFGFGYLFGLTGTTSLPLMMVRLQPVIHTPIAIAGLTLAFCGMFYKLAIFPFHFWTPDVYQGASNETASLVASLPKVGGIAVLVRLVSLASPDDTLIPILLSALAIVSMFYGNLIALVQTDLKRLLGFSSIAHAGYALVGFVALGDAGYAAALYYISGYMLMVLACFVVISRVSRDGTNVEISELAGLHRRSPLLAVTLLVGIFALAGIPPFVGFMGKLSLLTAAFARGHTLLVVITVLNSAVAVYYYLRVIRETFFGESEGERAPITLTPATITLCVLLLIAITALGVVPGPFVDAIAGSLATVNLPLPH